MEAIFTLVRTVLTVAIILTIAFRIFRILRPFERGLVERLWEVDLDRAFCPILLFS